MKMEDVDENGSIPNQTTEVKTPKKSKPVEPISKDTYHPIDDLPSKFKMYPKGTKLSARPLKVMEVKMLSTMNEDNANYVINQVLKKTVRGYSIDELYVSDKLFLIFWLRANTYADSGYSIEFECPLCEENSNYDFDLDCLDILDIKDDYDINKDIILPGSKHTIKVTQLKIKDENNVQNFIEKSKKLPIKYETDVLAIANLITHIDDKEITGLKQKYNYLLDIHPSDYAYLESYILHYEMGVNPFMDVKCNKCGGSSPMAVTFRADFFVPKYRF
jgi:hypothetical protein